MIFVIVSSVAVIAVLGAAVWLIARREHAVHASQSAAFVTKPISFGRGMAWIAVKSCDAAKVAGVLGLNSPQTVNLQRGISSLYDRRLNHRAILITPPINGWVIIAGQALPQPLGGGFADKCTPLVMSLSKKFGEAQYFLSFQPLDFFAWAKASNGDLQRMFATGDEGLICNNGRLTSAERSLGLKLYEMRGLHSRNGDAGGPMILSPTEAQVLSIAAQWSVNPIVLSENITLGAENGLLGQAPLSWRSERLLRQAA